MKKVAILGSTGSIGTQTLDVVRANPDRLKVHSLVAFSNTQKLATQVAEFSPQYSALISRCGKQCLVEAVKGCDIAVVATRGIVALSAVLYCLEKGIDVALANKEVLVCAGELVVAKSGKAKIFPVDSEHSAIWQCLAGHDKLDVEKILLTASGGPFFDLEKEQLHAVTAKQALQHPNWNMGSKITVDSATMVNKAFEVLEASRLFDVPTEKIEIVVHRQSIVHSLVQYKSGSIMAQLAMPDMHLPISLALLGEGTSAVKGVNFQDLLTLTFQECDFAKFPCAKLGYEIQNYPPLCATVMNAANDVCVESFLQGQLPFDAFYPTIIAAVEHFRCLVSGEPLTVENVEKYDSAAREFTLKFVRERL